MATLLRRVTQRRAFAAATSASSSNPEMQLSSSILFSARSFKQGICGSALQCREFSSKAKKKTKSSGTVPGEENMSKKDLALLQAIDHITSAFGKGAIMWLGRSQGYREVPVVSTGSFALDIALGTGWLPKGRVVEVFGPEASGKTTLALHVIAEAQKSGELEMRLRQLMEIEAPKEEAEDDSRKDLPEEIVSPETSSEEELAEMY